MTDSQSQEVPERKLQLMKAARRRFIMDGFARTPVSSIVKDAGVAQGTFYLYFKSKQDLINELQREVVRAYEAVLLKIGGQPGPGDVRLAQVIVAMSEEVARHVEIERVFRESGSGEGSLVALREGRRRLAHLAAQMIEAGGFPKVEDPMRMALFMVTLFDNILFDAHLFEPEAVDEVVVHSLRFVLRGAGVDHGRVERIIEFRHRLGALDAAIEPEEA